MDIITLAQAKKYAKALNDALEGDVEELDSDLIIVNADGDTACKIILNALRQHIWQSQDEAPICEEGTVTLTNTKKFPFNDSIETISLENRQRNQKYTVIAEVTSIAGNIGEIRISDKAVNGFKMEYTGSAATATVKYYVIGGIIK